MNSEGLFREQALIFQQGDTAGPAVFYQPLSLRVLLLLIVAGFLSVLFYAATVQLNQTVAVRGFLTSNEGEIKVYGDRYGMLEEIRVGNGDIVSEATLLATVRNNGFNRYGDDISARTHLYVDEQISQISERLQLNHERLKLQHSLGNGRRAALDQELDGRYEESRLVAGQLENAEAEFSRIQRLGAVHLISDSELTNAETSLLAMKKNFHLSQLSVNTVAAQRAELDTQQELDLIRLLDENLALAFTLSQLQQRKEEMELEQGYSLIAPTAGRIENLLNKTGDYINPRQPLLSIVPLEPSYKAQMFLPSRAIGKVVVGQEVTLIYDAFPFYEHGGFRGRIHSISAAPIDPREYLIPLEINEPAYLLEADLVDEHPNMRLRPGMQFSAELIVGSQTILSSILKPLRTLESRIK